MKQKHAIPILVISTIIISVASASAFTETRNGRQYTTSLEGSGVNKTPENAYRQAGFGIPVRYNNTTYIYGNYAVKNYQNNYVGDTHLDLITTPLTLEQIITTGEQYPDLKGVMGI